MQTQVFVAIIFYLICCIDHYTTGWIQITESAATYAGLSGILSCILYANLFSISGRGSCKDNDDYIEKSCTLSINMIFAVGIFLFLPITHPFSGYVIIWYYFLSMWHIYGLIEDKVR